MDQSLRLAALASAAVPGLDPIAVQEIFLGAEEPFDVAFIQDSQQRRWVIRAPRTEVAAARMDASLAMLALLVRRVPFAVPAAKGFAPIPKIGRAAVHSYIPGDPLDLAALHPAHSLTAELGRMIAMIHNVDRALYDEAGLPAYDSETYRKRHLAEIDRGAATGRVPAGLLARWEEALDDVRLWRFAPTPVHGSLHGGQVLVTFPDRTDSAKGTIRGVTGWEAAKVADPADDFAALIASTRTEVVDAVFAAYAQVRVERPDQHLLGRARLASELDLLAQLMRAVSNRDDVVTEALTARLRRLDDAVHDERQARRLRIVPAAPVSGYAPPAKEVGTQDIAAHDVPLDEGGLHEDDALDDDHAREDTHDGETNDSEANDNEANDSEANDSEANDNAIEDDATDVIDAIEAQDSEPNAHGKSDNRGGDHEESDDRDDDGEATEGDGPAGDDPAGDQPERS